MAVAILQSAALMATVFDRCALPAIALRRLVLTKGDQPAQTAGQDAFQERNTQFWP